MEILEKENVKIDCLTGHGGLFKTPVVGQKLMAGAMNSPIAVMETAGEGGAWGMAILAKYAVDNSSKSLPEYLKENVFSKCKSSVINPDNDDVLGFEKYMKLYKSALNVQKSAYKYI
jgi:sugar (pentulose or hexulose) kinase